MKKIVYLIQSVVVVAALFFTSCEADKGVIYEPEGTTYSFATPSIIRAIAAEDGSTITFDLYRAGNLDAAAIPLEVTSNSTALSLSSETANFAAGQAVCTLTLNHPTADNMSATGTYTMSVSIPEDTVSVSGTGTTSFSLTRQLTYKNAGKVLFYDGTFVENETLAEVVIQQSVEAETIWRLISPMNAVRSSSYAAGNHLVFMMNPNDGTPIGIPNGTYEIFPEAGYSFYYDATNYPAYCSFTKDGAEYEINFLLRSGTSLYTGGYFWFRWVDGYPGN